MTGIVSKKIKKIGYSNFLEINLWVLIFEKWEPWKEDQEIFLKKIKMKSKEKNFDFIKVFFELINEWVQERTYSVYSLAKKGNKLKLIKNDGSVKTIKKIEDFESILLEAEYEQGL